MHLKGRSRVHLGTAVRPLLPKSATVQAVIFSGATRVLLVGTGRRAVQAARALQMSPQKTHVLGTLDSDPQPDLAAEFPKIPLLGGFDNLLDVIVDQAIDEIQVALPLRSCFDQVQNLQSECKQLGVPITFRLSLRSEERRVGKECRSRWSPYH